VGHGASLLEMVCPHYRPRISTAQGKAFPLRGWGHMPMASVRVSTASLTCLAALRAARFTRRWEGAMVMPRAAPAAAPAARPRINVPKPCPFIPRLLLFRRPAGFRRKRGAGDLTSKAGAAGLCLFFPEAGKNPLLNPAASAII